MEIIEPRPKPTTFNLTMVDKAQLIVDPSRIGEQVCRNLMSDDADKSKGQPFVYLFVIQANRTVLILTQGGSIAPSRKTTRSMDRAMDMWRSLENDGWAKISADFWYGGPGGVATPKKDSVGVVTHSTAQKTQALMGVEGKICDLGYGYCIISTKPVPVSPTFYVRRRNIVKSKY